jgi:hypothetical protein
MEESKQGNVIDLVAEAAAAPAITMFKINNNPYTCQAAVNKLREIKRSSNLDGWNSFEVCTDGEGVSQTPKLRCKHCTVLFAVSNPSQTLKTHLTARACTGLKRRGLADAAAAAAAEEGTSGGGAAAASSSAVSSGKRKKGTCSKAGRCCRPPRKTMRWLPCRGWLVLTTRPQCRLSSPA